MKKDVLVIFRRRIKSSSFSRSLLSFLLWAAFSGAAAAQQTAFAPIDPLGQGPVAQGIDNRQGIDDRFVYDIEPKYVLSEPDKISLAPGKSAIIRLDRNVGDVLVSNPEIADAVIRSSTQIYLLGVNIGKTDISFFDDQGSLFLSFNIDIAHDTATLAEMYRRLFPQTDIRVDAINDNLVLTGAVKSAGDSAHAVNMARRYIVNAGGDPESVLNFLTVEGGQQVLLQVKVVEIQRSILRQLGVDLGGAVEIGKNNFLRLASSNPFLFGSGSIASGSTLAFNRVGAGRKFTLDSIIRALESHSLARVLAEPNLTAISGEVAEFLAGGEYPVPTAAEDDGGVTVTFKQFGIGLSFAPVVLNEDRINLRISTEVSEISDQNAISVNVGTNASNQSLVQTIPGVRLRRAETTVEIGSGRSLVMAGLIQEQTRQGVNGYPGLKDIPILGELFRSRSFQRSETELVIIVTPYLVDPVDPGKLATPRLSPRPLNVFERGFLNRVQTAYDLPYSPADAWGLPAGRPNDSGQRSKPGYVLP